MQDFKKNAKYILIVIKQAVKVTSFGRAAFSYSAVHTPLTF